MTALMLFATDRWIVLVPGPRAIGPFSSGKKAKNFAACRGGIATTWWEPEGMCEGWDHEGAIWFNNDWNAPSVIGGPFFDCEDVWAVCTFPGTKSGIAIDLEYPDDFWTGPDEPDEVPANDNRRQNRAA